MFIWHYETKHNIEAGWDCVVRKSSDLASSSQCLAFYQDMSSLLFQAKAELCMGALLSLLKFSMWLAACVRKGPITKKGNAFSRKVSSHLHITLPRNIGVQGEKSHTSLFESGSQSICLDTNNLLQKITNFFNVTESSSCLAIPSNIQVPQRTGCKLQHPCIVSGDRHISRFLQRKS